MKISIAQTPCSVMNVISVTHVMTQGLEILTGGGGRLMDEWIEVLLASHGSIFPGTLVWMLGGPVTRAGNESLRRLKVYNHGEGPSLLGPTPS